LLQQLRISGVVLFVSKPRQAGFFDGQKVEPKGLKQAKEDYGKL